MISARQPLMEGRPVLKPINTLGSAALCGLSPLVFKIIGLIHGSGILTSLRRILILSYYNHKTSLWLQLASLTGSDKFQTQQAASCVHPPPAYRQVVGASAPLGC